MKVKVTFFLNNIITEQLISATKAWFWHVTSNISNLKISNLRWDRNYVCHVIYLLLICYNACINILN